MESIILEKIGNREVDVLLSVLTKYQGKRTFLSKGVKKITSKNAGVLEPGSYVFSDIVEGKQYGYIIKAQKIREFPNLLTNVSARLCAQVVLSRVSTILKEGVNDTALFLHVLALFEFLDKVSPQAEVDPLILDAFFLQFAGCLGFAPDMFSCVQCGIPVKELLRSALFDKKPEGDLWFSCASGGIFCGFCSTEDKRAIGPVFLLNTQLYSDLLLLSTGSFFDIQQFEDLQEVNREYIHKIVVSYLSYHTESSVLDWDIRSFFRCRRVFCVGCLES